MFMQTVCGALNIGGHADHVMFMQTVCVVPSMMVAMQIT